MFSRTLLALCLWLLCLGAWATGYTTGSTLWGQTATGGGVQPTVYLRSLAADATGQNVNTAQPWFPSTGAVVLQAATSYLFSGRFWSTRAAGATSHTTGIGFGGTATLTDITWWGLAKEGETGDRKSVV